MKSLGLLLLALPCSALAELQWERTSQKFTYAPGESVMKTGFAATNAGRAPLKITMVKSGCVCCTSARAAKKVLAPGEKTTVTVRVDVGGKDLPLLKPVVIGTDDGKFTTLLVHVVTADGKPLKVPLWGAPKRAGAR